MTKSSHGVIARSAAARRNRSLMLSASVGALILAGGQALALSTTYIAGNDWTIAGNWNNGVPTAADIAKLNQAGTVGTALNLNAIGNADQVSIDGGNELDVGAGGNLTVVQTVTVGAALPGLSELTVAAGGGVTADSLVVGYGTAGANGLVTVDGAGSTLLANSTLLVGGNGIGQIDLTNGGALMTGAALTRVGIGPGMGVMNIDAASSYSNFAGSTAIGAVGTVITAGTFFSAQQITSTGSVTNTGMFIGGTGISNLGAGILTNNAGGTVVATTGDVTNGATLNNFGLVQAVAGNVVNTVTGVLTNNPGATVVAGGNVTNRGQIINTGIIIGSTGVSNAGGATITNNLGGMLVTTAGAITNAGTITNRGSVIATGGNFDNNAGGLLTNNLGGIVTTNQFVTNSGQIINTGIVAGGAGFTNNAAGVITNNAGASVRATGGDFTNSGTLTNSGDVAATVGNIINTATGTLTNNAGATVNAALTVQNSNVLNNNGGTVIGGTGIVNFAGGTLNNDFGGLIVATTGNIVNSGVIVNDVTGTGGNIQATAGAVVNLAGATLTNNAFGVVTAGTNVVNSGQITNSGVLTGATGIINNLGGVITNNLAGTVTATTGDIVNSGTLNNNNAGVVQALAGNVVNNATGVVVNNATVTAAAQVVNNGLFTNNSVVTGGTGLINGGTFINNAAATATATTGNVVNSKNLTNFGLVRAVAGNVINAVGGTILNKAGATLRAGLDVSNAATLINDGTVLADAGNIANLATGSLTNNVGGVMTAGALVTNAGTMTNSATITGGTGVSNAAGATINNLATGILTATLNNVTNAGTIINAGMVRALAGSVVNTGTLISTGTVAGLAGGLVNSGTVIASGTVSGGVNNTGLFSVSGALNNNGGAFTNAGLGQLIVDTGNILTNVTTLTNTSTRNPAVLVKAGASIFAATAIDNNAGVFNNQGTINAPTISNAATLFNTGSVQAATFNNTGVANMSGTLATLVSNNSGTFNVFGNLAGPTATFNNTGTVNLAANQVGITTYNNSGTLFSAGNRTLGAGTFNNLPTGVISMLNGQVVDSLTLTGPNPLIPLTAQYVGAAGSVLNADIDLSKFNGQRADLLKIDGTATGRLNVQFNLLPGRVGFINPINVLQVLGNPAGLTINTGSLVGLNGTADQGFFKYYLRESAPGTGLYQVISQFNAAPATGVASGLSGMVTALQAGFHQPNSAIISRPDECVPNQLMGGPFIRANAGDTTVDSNGRGALTTGGSSFTGSASSRAQFKGIQGGFDLGVCNIQGTGWNIHGGFMSGYVEVESKSNARTADAFGNAVSTLTRSKVEVPFFGLYSFVTKGPFTFEANIRKDFYQAKINSSDTAGITYVGPQERLTGNGMNYNVAASYRFAIGESMYFEPAVGFSKGIVRFRNLQFATAATDFMSFDRSDSMLGRIGFNVGYTFLATDKLAVVPFAHASVWREFAGVNKAYASIGAGPQVFEIRTDRVGTFGQLGAGVQFKLLDSPFLGFIRGDMRFGDKIEGKAFNAGLRMQF